jgi:hypothetical protein
MLILFSSNWLNVLASYLSVVWIIVVITIKCCMLIISIKTSNLLQNFISFQQLFLLVIYTPTAILLIESYFSYSEKGA